MPPLSYAVRLRAPYAELAQTIGEWSLHCEKVVCYEHPEKADNIHVHLLLVNVRITTDGMKAIMRRHGVTLKGAGQVSFKAKFKHFGMPTPITPNNHDKYIIYMSKGKHDAKFNMGFTQEFLDECKAAWVNFLTRSEKNQEYEDFKSYVEERESAFHAETLQRNPTRPATVHVYACEFILKKYNGFIPHVARKQIKDLKDNYCVEIGLIGWSRFALPFERLEN